jgi:hydrogenase maturation protease
MEKKPVRCLLLACGNSLRGDDGAGPWLAAWAAKRFSSAAGLRVVVRLQWAPELAQDLAQAESAIFVDASTLAAPGVAQLHPVAPCADSPALTAHHLDAPELLALARQLYDSIPGNAWLLTIGIGSTELGETFSAAVQQGLPRACLLLEDTVRGLLGDPQRS